MSHHKFKDQTLLDFNVKLSRLDWSTVFQSSDTNNAYGNFCKIYTNTIKSVRFKQKPCGKTMEIRGILVSMNKRVSLCLTPHQHLNGLLRAMNKKNALYKKTKKCHSKAKFLMLAEIAILQEIRS